MDMKELSSILQQNGIVGAGGAGFPTYAKLDERAETIILNCAECEPLLRLHRQLLEKYAKEIIDTFHMIGETVGAKEVIIGIKKAYTATIEAVKAVMGQYPEVRLGLLDEVYPAGDEVVLIYETTGKVVRPGGLPIESGVAVFNVETVYNVYRALNEKTPVEDKLVSVVAEVEHPITVRVPIGTPLEEVVALAGGVTTKDAVYFVGGPMMGNIGTGAQPVTKTTNAILVLPKDHHIIQKKLKKAQKASDKQYEDMKLRIQYMYENGGTTALQTLFSSKDLAEFLNTAESVSKISQYARMYRSRTSSSIRCSAHPADFVRCIPVSRDFHQEVLWQSTREVFVQTESVLRK